MKYDSLLLIAICAVVTYSLRFGGLLLSKKLPQKGRFKRALDILPAAILISYVTPPIVKSGPAGVVAAAVIAILTKITGKVLLSTAAGVLLLVALNYFQGI